MEDRRKAPGEISGEIRTGALNGIKMEIIKKQYGNILTKRF
jgi:hypothetical protein